MVISLYVVLTVIVLTFVVMEMGNGMARHYRNKKQRYSESFRDSRHDERYIFQEQ